MSQLGCLSFHLTRLSLWRLQVSSSMHLFFEPQCWFPGAGVRKHSQSWAKPASQSGTPGQQARWFSLSAILQGKSSKAAKALWEIWGPREVTQQNVCLHAFPCLLGEGHWQVCVFHIYNACFLFLLVINYVFRRQPLCCCCSVIVGPLVFCVLSTL